MREGWLGDEYVVLFDDSEVILKSDKYRIDVWLPGFQVLGLRGWDDFIVRDSAGRIYTVPTVPMHAKYLSPYTIPANFSLLEPDENVRGKIKWYIKPLVFGGEPTSHRNRTWLSHEKHVELVNWWNQRYTLDER